MEELSGRPLRTPADVRAYTRDVRDSDKQRRRQLWREAALVIVLMLSFLQYYFIDIQLRILALQSVVVFGPEAPKKAAGG